MLMTVMLFGCFGITGCNFESQFESDGKFKYYYDESRDGYIIVGTEEAGFSDPMYVPAYYKGKSVVGTSYWKIDYIGSAGVSYYMDTGGAQTVYYPFGVRINLNKVHNSTMFIISTEFRFEDPFKGYDNKNTLYYVTNNLFEDAYMYMSEINETFYEKNQEFLYRHEKISEACLEFQLYNSDAPMVVIKRANVAYMFNYENALNEGYFFINNFEQGEKITNTPYEPLREGYVFDGWYKETECINAVNFNKDTVLDEEKETKLYAKWIEN